MLYLAQAGDMMLEATVHDVISRRIVGATIMALWQNETAAIASSRLLDYCRPALHFNQKLQPHQGKLTAGFKDFGGQTPRSFQTHRSFLLYRFPALTHLRHLHRRHQRGKLRFQLANCCSPRQ